MSPTPRSVGVDLPVSLNFSTVLSYNQKNRPTEQLYFKNPYRAPLWVDEFHFTLGAPALVPTGPVMNVGIPEGVIGMRMKINDKYIIDEFVPLTLLGPHTDVSESRDITSAYRQYSFFWRLAKPMWLDELDDLLIELNWIGSVGDLYDPAVVLNLASPVQTISNAVPITVTMCGRSTVNANRPKERALPFNAVWGPQLLETTIDTEFAIRSPDSALRNGREKPVVINRIMGQMPMWKYSSLGTATSQYSPTSNFLMNLRISHSLGYYLVKDLTPFFELFQNVSREAAFKFVLQPKEFITVELQTSPLTLVNYPQEAAPFRYLSGFALQGYSMEALP